MDIKRILRHHPKIKNIIARCYAITSPNSFHIRGKFNQIKKDGAFLKGCRFTIKGNNNTILIDGTAFTKLTNCNIKITGSYNMIIIGKDVSTSITMTIEDNNNKIILGERFRGGGKSELAAIEGTTITFGSDCMLSANITIRTGDSHSIIDAETKGRTNPSRSVFIGDHVWIGNTVLIFKGTDIGSNSIVGGGSVVSGKKFPSNSLIAGNPAKVVKEGVDWKEERTPTEQTA